MTLCLVNAYDDCEYFFVVGMLRKELFMVLSEKANVDFEGLKIALLGYLKGRLTVWTNAQNHAHKSKSFFSVKCGEIFNSPFEWYILMILTSGALQTQSLVDF